MQNNMTGRKCYLPPPFKNPSYAPGVYCITNCNPCTLPPYESEATLSHYIRKVVVPQTKQVVLLKVEKTQPLFSATDQNQSIKQVLKYAANKKVEIMKPWHQNAFVHLPGLWQVPH